MFDAHTHLHDPRLRDVFDAVVAAAARAQVTGLCCCGTSPADWPAVAAVAVRTLPLVAVPAFGVHPWYAEGLPGDWEARLAAALEAHPVAALGEVGLDGVRGEVPPEMQERVLVRQLELAARLGRPVVLHGARAWGRLVEVVAPFAGKVPGFVAHGFGGSGEILRRVLQLGGYVSFAGTVCNPNAGRVRAAARAAPDDRILVETDAPDLFPLGGAAAGVGAEGRPLNQPSNLARVVAEVAALRGMTAEELSDLTGTNARRFLQ